MTDEDTDGGEDSGRKSRRKTRRNKRAEVPAPTEPEAEVVETADIPPTVLGAVGGAGLAADTTVEVVGPDGGPAQVIDVHPGGAVQRPPGAPAVHSFSGRGGAAVTGPTPHIATHGQRGGASVVIQAPPPRVDPRREASRKNDTRSAARPLSLRDFELSKLEGGGESYPAHAEHESGGSLNRRWGQIPIGEHVTLGSILVSEPALKYAKPTRLRVTRQHAGAGSTFRLMVILGAEAPATPLIDASKYLGTSGGRTGLFEALGYAITQEASEGPAERTEVEVWEGDVVSILWEANGNRRCMHYVCLCKAAG